MSRSERSDSTRGGSTALSALPSPRQLGYLVALAERLNFRAAAEACHVTQSTLSAGIKQLESMLGVRLLERDKRNVRVTAVGREIVERASAVLGAARDLVETAKAGREPLHGQLRLGAIPTIAPFLLPRMLPPLRKRYPGLKLHLREDLTDRLLGRLRAGDLDVALIALPYETGELHVQPLFKDEFWFVARADDPFAKAKAIAVERLDLGDVILLEEGHCLSEHVIAACSAARKRAGPSGIEATSLPTLLQMVEGGLGVTLLPEIALKAGLLNGTQLVARPFSTRVPSRTIALVSRQSSAHREDLEILGQFLSRQHAAQANIPRTRH